MILKKTLSIGLAGIMGFSLVGCSKVGNSMASIPPLTMEEVAGKRMVSMTMDERDAEIYKYVTDRIVVDKEKLISIQSKDMSEVNKLLSNVNEFLKGQKNDALTEEYGNYLLVEFANTPYEWQQARVEPVGFDPAARLYFVDVTYTTTDVLKKVIPDSKIPKGAKDELLLKQQRYNDYLAYLTYKQSDFEKGELARQDFIKRWGDIDSIFQEQQGVSLLNRTRQTNNDSGGIGKLTYTGLVNDSKLATDAQMTFRYVFKYKFNLGEETDLAVESVYLKDYELENADNILKSYTLRDETGVEVLKPFMDRLINSYHKAVESTNHLGLSTLISNYGTLDKYYEDINNFTYLSTGGYTYKILSRTGTNVVVQVDRVNRIRAKGAEISLPTYDETLLMNLVLDTDDTIRIRNIFPIKKTMIGEPLSVIKNVSGVSDLIQYSSTSFTDSNKKEIENTLKTFSKLVLQGDVESQEFLNTVDLGVSQVTLQRMVDNIKSMKAKKKTTYIISWDTATNVYASVTLREIFETKSGNFDTEAVVDLVNRNGVWKVVNYTRTLNVKTGAVGNLDKKNVLTVDEVKK